MTKEEIKNTPELVDFMLDKCILAESRAKVHKRLEEVCDLAIKALDQESKTRQCKDCKYLDKIRAEIEQMDFDFWDSYDLTSVIREMVLEVIDKY